MNKIDIFGDSILKGVMYNESEKKYTLYSNRLSDFTGDGIEVCNNSRMGATVEKGYKLLTTRLRDVAPGETVLLGYGGNDCNYNWAEVAAAPDCEHLPAIPPSRFNELYRSSVDYIRSLGAKVAVANLVPLDAKKFMAWISRDLSYDNIIKWLGDMSILYRWQEYYNRLVENIARDCGCPLIDLRTPFLQHHDFPSLLCADGIHPTEKGHELIKTTLRISAEMLTA